MYPLFFHQPAKNEDDQLIKRAMFTQQYPDYANEGSEFLDDAIRIKDQPLTYTEDAVAPGCPDGLL
jgi:hypothetical protein